MKVSIYIDGVQCLCSTIVVVVVVLVYLPHVLYFKQSQVIQIFIPCNFISQVFIFSLSFAIREFYFNFYYKPYCLVAIVYVLVDVFASGVTSQCFSLVLCKVFSLLTLSISLIQSYKY